MSRKTLSRPMRLPSVAVVIIALTGGCQAFAPGFAEFGGERVRDLRDRAAQRDTILALRLETLMPMLMEQAGVDCWLTLADGPAGDAAFSIMTMSATRLEGKGALLICNEETGLVAAAFGGGLEANAPIYEIVEPSVESPLAELLNDRLRDLAPRRIGINDARSFPAADGLTASNERWLREHLEAEWSDRLVSSRPLVESLLAGQIDAEAPLFTESARLMAAILDEVLSEQVIVAAGTSLLDLDWAIRDRAAQLNVELVYPPRSVVYRPSSSLEAERRMQLDLKLQPGDLVFVSSGIRYLGYANRLGRWVYLLPAGETAAPAWVNEALAGLADAAEDVASAIAPGQDATSVLDAAGSAIVGLVDPFVAVDRVGRLQEGAIDPGTSTMPMALWGGNYRLAAGTGLAITLSTTVLPPAPGARPLSLLLTDTALVGTTDTDFIVPVQRTPLLIHGG